MKNNPQERWGTDQHASDECHSHADAVDFMITMIGATICSSGQDYNAALERIFPQLQALGQMVDARNLDEVSDCLRATCMPG